MLGNRWSSRKEPVISGGSLQKLRCYRCVPSVQEIGTQSSRVKSSKTLREKRERWLVTTILCSVYNRIGLEAHNTPGDRQVRHI